MRNYISGLSRDIVIDAAQYLYTFSTTIEIATNDNLPQTRFHFRRSLLSANIYVHPMDTPIKWFNYNSQWKPGRGGTKPTNDLNTPYTPREGNQPRYKGDQLSGNTWYIEHIQTNRSLHPTLERLRIKFHCMNMS